MVESAFPLRTDDDALRLVYYGPGRSGKTTNLERLAARLEGGAERLLRMPLVGGGGACEFLACDAAELGWPVSARLHCHAAPGAYLLRRARERLLHGADGVIFTADARRWRLDADLVLLDELGARLAAAGRVPPATGLVLQYNRMDDPEALSAARLDHELNRHGGPSVPAVAVDGVGVVETLHVLLARILPDGRPRR